MLKENLLQSLYDAETVAKIFEISPFDLIDYSMLSIAPRYSKRTL